MKKKNHFLDETIKRTKIENAQKEARDIYNYNQWKDRHDRMVDQELRKLNRKAVSPGKAIIIGILLAFLIEVFIILINNQWKDRHDRMVDQELRKLNRKAVSPGKAIIIGILLAFLIEVFIILINNDINTIGIALDGIKDHLREIGKILLELSTIK